MANLFHLTKKALVERIEREGLLPGQESRFDGSKLEPNKACVYMSDRPKMCQTRCGFGSEVFIPDDYVVLVIESNYLDYSLFRPDEDYLARQLSMSIAEARAFMDDHADLWEESLECDNSVAYRGEVPPEAIWEVLHFVKEGEKAQEAS